MILQHVFGLSAEYDIRSFIKDLDGHSTYKTFPRLIAFYLQQSDFSNLNAMIPNTSCIVNYLPGEQKWVISGPIPELGTTPTMSTGALLVSRSLLSQN